MLPFGRPVLRACAHQARSLGPLSNDQGGMVWWRPYVVAFLSLAFLSLAFLFLRFVSALLFVLLDNLSGLAQKDSLWRRIVRLVFSANAR